ncbi:curli assembly protein CsgF [Devosia algicola]|uniref:Curli production assembly/transport component CsgF n=1 Tax=Devosia algicola TaxID=3026418 RepID=A0ABY7YJ92_9HYPH|nr:curli assembly protein CsgF [Devosia algicola]WDR01349.1 curli assembly protein CsgF [Devosia algicola]
MLTLLCVAGMSSGAFAADLVYTPINPAFGGNPGNSSHLLSVAGAQKTATASDAPITSTSTGGSSGSGSGSSTSGASLFVSQLQGRLLSALASQVTDAIFGANPQNHGTVTFGDTTVVFDNTGSAINLTITDPTGVTVISVPQLVVTP